MYATTIYNFVILSFLDGFMSQRQSMLKENISDIGKISDVVCDRVLDGEDPTRT